MRDRYPERHRRRQLPDFPTVDQVSRSMAESYANPWIDLPRSSSTPLWKVHDTWSRPFDLFGLPNELLCMISECLPKESRAALALVNHFFKDLLGPSAVDFTYRRPGGLSRFNFLRLLEHDLDDRVACPCCLMLHHPRIKDCKFRIFAYEKLVEFTFFQYRPRPVDLCYNAVRAAAIRHIRTGADPSLDFRPDARHFLHKYLKIVRTSQARFIDGTLITRVQTVIAPVRTTRRGTRESARWLANSVTPTPAHGNNRGCQHGSYGEISPRLIKSLFEGKGYSEANVKIDRCPYCATESADWYNILPGVGPVNVLTVWNDFGGPGYTSKWKWNSQLTAAGDPVTNAEIGSKVEALIRSEALGQYHMAGNVVIEPHVIDILKRPYEVEGTFDEVSEQMRASGI